MTSVYERVPSPFLTGIYRASTVAGSIRMHPTPEATFYVQCTSLVDRRGCVASDEEKDPSHRRQCHRRRFVLGFLLSAVGNGRQRVVFIAFKEAPFICAQMFHSNEALNQRSPRKRCCHLPRKLTSRPTPVTVKRENEKVEDARSPAKNEENSRYWLLEHTARSLGKS